MVNQTQHVMLVLILIFCSCSSGAVIFVDHLLPEDCIGTYSIANRDNSGSDGDAYNTPQKAADVVEPGDVVYFRAGTYYQHANLNYDATVMTVLRSGTADSPITFASYNNEEVILSGVRPGDYGHRQTVILGIEPTNYVDVSGQGVQNIILDGLTITGGHRRGMMIAGPVNRYASAENPTENVTVRNCVIRDNGPSALSVRGDPGYGIITRGTLVSVVIENCEAYGNTGTAIQYGDNRWSSTGEDWHDPEPEDDTSAAQYCVLRNCLIYNNINAEIPGNTDGCGSGFSYHVTLENNIVFNNSDDGIDCGASVGNIIKNNIVFGHYTDGGNQAGIKFSAGGGGRHTAVGNKVFNNGGYSIEGGQPGHPLRTYYPSKLYDNLAYNGDGGRGISLGDYADTTYPGFEKAYLRNNIALDNYGHDIKGMVAGEIDSDHNFITNTGDLATLQSLGQDAHSLTGEAGLVNKTVVIDTNFASDWTFEQKVEHIRSQVKAAFSLGKGSALLDGGVVVDGYHSPDPGEQPGDGEDWYGSAPDIGPYEVVLADINDLAPAGTGDDYITLTWTVPDRQGYTAQPTEYDIRYVEGALTETTWETATQVPGTPVPDSVGQQDSFTVTGLSPDTEYSFGMKTGDEQGNISWLSNVVSATTTTGGNHAPLIDVADQSAFEMQELQFTVGATDADTGDTLTYSAPLLPSGATFTGGTRTFTWTPVYEQIGTHYATFAVTDGQVTVSETITIAVASGSNHAPVLSSIGNKSVDEGDALSFSITATDVDGQSLTYSTGALPTGASFSGQTFTWTPGYTQAGNYNVTFTVSDGSAQDSETITIAVGNINQAPVLAAVSDQGVNENALLTFSVSGTDPDGDSVSYSATGLPSGANFVSGTFSWVPSFSQAGSYTVTFTASDGSLTDSDQATIVVANVSDTTAPVASATYPEADAIQVPLNALIDVTISDPGWGIDANTVELQVDGQVVYSGNVASYDSAYGTCQRTGTEASYVLHYQPDDEYDFDESVAVRVGASDQANNVMTPYAYTFTTEMRSFGYNKSVSWGPSDVDKGQAATACDSAGTIWAVYHAGPVGQRDVYISKLAPGTLNFSGPTQLTTDAGDQAYPKIAIDGNDKIYVIWRDDRQGDWDVYGQTSPDGVNWSTAVRISDSTDPETAPAIAADPQSPGTVWMAWQRRIGGQQDICVSSSSSDFATNATSRVTSDSAHQTGPDITVDASGTAYLVWTDVRNGTADIYGADSANGPWTNVPVATGSGDQHSPCIGVEATGTGLHFAWVDTASGDSDIHYADSDGMPSGTLTGTNVVDDTSGAEQTAPSLAVSGSSGAGLEVFLCWKDERNLGSVNVDTDLYFTMVETGSETNILVGDGGTRSGQSEPSMAIDGDEYPYVVWTDGRNVTVEIYYAGSSRADDDVLDEGTVTTASNQTIGVASPTGVGDVSVLIPAGACAHDVTVTIMAMENPSFASSEAVLAYEFSPSGLQFSAPVTITIPYAVANFPEGTPKPYWYDSQTGSLSQSGITDIQSLVLSDTIHALRFKTTHFTPYGLFDTAISSGGGGGGGGGGCALSPMGRGGLVAFLLPYLVIAGTVSMLKRRDRRLQRGAHQ